MRALVAFIVLLALLFVGFGTYVTFQQRREAESLHRKAMMAHDAQLAAAQAAARTETKGVTIGQDTTAARKAEARRVAEGKHGPSPMPKASYDYSIPAHRLSRPEAIPFEEAIAKLCASFAAQDSKARDATRAALSQDDLYTLMHFAKRSAVFTVRTRAKARCTQGWTAIAMVDVERIDSRDLLSAIGLLDHATRRIAKDSKDITAQLAPAKSLATPGVVAILELWATRRRSKRELSAWGYAEIETNGQVGFIRSEGEEYEPRHDLAKIGFAISDSLDKSRYSPHGITIATEIPPAWFKAGEETELKRRIARARGTVTIGATPLRAPSALSHQFVVFLCETSSEADREWLAAAVQREGKGGSVAAVGVREVLCVVVSRAVTINTQPLDTPEAVERLAKGIGEVLRAQLGPGK